MHLALERLSPPPSVVSPTPPAPSKQPYDRLYKFLIAGDQSFFFFFDLYPEKMVSNFYIFQNRNWEIKIIKKMGLRQLLRRIWSYDWNQF